MEERDQIFVLWVDDDPVVRQSYPIEAESEGIWLKACSCWDEAWEELKDNYEKWSAIILDANCVHHKGDGENVVKFLGHALNDITRLRAERGRLIPWYVLSGGAEKDISDSILEERMEWDADWTKETAKTFYSKNTDRQILYQRIVEHHRISHKLQIQKDYKVIFDAIDECKLNDGVHDIIIDLLIPIYYPKDIDPKDYNDKFKKVRVVLEYIFQSMIENGILPNYGDETNISWSIHILAGNSAKDRSGNEIYKSKRRLLPVILCSVLKTMVYILSSDVHSKSQNEEKPNMSEYLQLVEHSTMLLKSFVFQLCDFIIWYKGYLQDHQDKNENMKLWTKVETQDLSDHKEKIELEGILEQHEGLFHIGTEFTVYLKRKELLGKKVKIINYCNNTNTKTKDRFPYFVREHDFELVEEADNGSK